MTRRKWLAIGLAATGCSKPSVEREALPERAGGWRRMAVEDLAPETAPPIIQRLGLRRIRRARYEGDKTLSVVVYEMATEASAFEVMQRWRVEARTLPFHNGSFFYLVDSYEDSPVSRTAFARAIEKALK